MFEVLSHAGFRYLGGIHFDRRIVDYVAEEFKKTEGIDLREDKQALQVRGAGPPGQQLGDRPVC